MPMFMKRLKAVQIGLGKSFFAGPEALGSWQANEETPLERIRVLDPAPDSRAVNMILERVRRLFPTLADVKLSESWGGYVDSTPDAVPVVSAVNGMDGFYLAAGCSGHGFGLGPGIGRLAAELVTNDTPCVDPTPFKLSRLLDGSKIEVGAI
jgi:glycine/D-amino acid oxidase-like deaminating enzyme